jgi:hypothetical protein
MNYYEKFTIRKKMTKVERIRMIFSTATSLGAKTTAIQDLLRILASEENSNEVILDNLDFGKQDILEARFQIDLAEKIKNKMTSWNGQNIDKTSISKLLQAETENDFKFKITLKKEDNFLTANPDSFAADNLLDLLALCLVCDSKNIAVNIDFNDDILNCEIVPNVGAPTTDDLENIILSAILA